MRAKGGDRCWWRWAVVHGEPRLQLCSVLGGVRTTRLLPREATEKDAARAVRIVEAGIASGTLDAPSTWEEAVEAFVAQRRGSGCRPATCESYSRNLAAVGLSLSAPDPLTLTAAHGATHAARRLESGRSPSTVKGELEAVTIMQRWMVGEGWIPVATWADVRRPEALPRQDHLYAHEVGPFLRAAERLADRWPTWPAAAWVLMHGLRTREAQHLLVGDIDLTDGILWVHDRAGRRTKSASSVRGVPVLAEAALLCLRRTFAGRPLDEPCFSTGRILAEEREEVAARVAAGRTKWFERRTYATCEAAGIRRVSPHALRHTVATVAVAAGAEMNSVGAFLGHRDAKVTERVYSHASSHARARSAAVAVGAWFDRTLAGSAVLEVVDGGREPSSQSINKRST